MHAMIPRRPSAPDRSAIGWPWEDEADHDATPRLRHWLMAVAILLTMSVAVPVFAAFA